MGDRNSMHTEWGFEYSFRDPENADLNTRIAKIVHCEVADDIIMEFARFMLDAGFAKGSIERALADASSELRGEIWSGEEESCTECDTCRMCGEFLDCCNCEIFECGP